MPFVLDISTNMVDSEKQPLLDDQDASLAARNSYREWFKCLWPRRPWIRQIFVFIFAAMVVIVATMEKSILHSTVFIYWDLSCFAFSTHSSLVNPRLIAYLPEEHAAIDPCDKSSEAEGEAFNRKHCMAESYSIRYQA